MKRIITRYKSGEHTNLPVDFITVENGKVFAWCDDELVQVVCLECVETVYVSEKKEG